MHVCLYLRNKQEQVESMLQSTKIPEGLANAQQLAVSTIAKYGNPQKQGGLHWRHVRKGPWNSFWQSFLLTPYFSTYKAVVRRNGTYSSGTAGQIDFNQALAEPLFRSVSVNWGM